MSYSFLHKAPYGNALKMLSKVEANYTVSKCLPKRFLLLLWLETRGEGRQPGSAQNIGGRGGRSGRWSR